MRQVMDDVRHQTAMNPASSSSSSAASNGAETNGNGNTKKANGSNGVEAGGDKPNLALPQAVVEDALRVTRESLEMVCEIEGDGT